MLTATELTVLRMCCDTAVHDHSEPTPEHLAELPAHERLVSLGYITPDEHGVYWATETGRRALHSARLLR